MALPLIAAGIAIGAAVLHENNKSHYKNIERERINFTGSDNSAPDVKKMPSDTYSSHLRVTPEPGSLVCCEVFNVVEHTGIWIDSETIVELSNNGLVKAVSASRFLEERSGEEIFVACRYDHSPIVLPETVERTVSQIFTYREYDLIANNCHRFSYYCLTGVDKPLSRFSTLNTLLAGVIGDHIYWDKVKY
jgi:hypothetical protein